MLRAKFTLANIVRSLTTTLTHALHVRKSGISQCTFLILVCPYVCTPVRQRKKAIPDLLPFPTNERQWYALSQARWFISVGTFKQYFTLIVATMVDGISSKALRKFLKGNLHRHHLLLSISISLAQTPFWKLEGPLPAQGRIDRLLSGNASVLDLLYASV